MKDEQTLGVPASPSGSTLQPSVSAAIPNAAAECAEDWRHLKDYGYAPGGYMTRCRTCGDTPTMDKRAWRCRPCAESALAAQTHAIAEFLQRTGQYVTNDATREAALQEARKLGEERVTGLLGEALMCATDHLDFNALERSHCNSMAKIRRGLAAYAELSGNLTAAHRAGSAQSSATTSGGKEDA